MDLYDLVVAPFAEFDFMRYALASIFCLALSAAPVGVFLVMRRMSLVGDALSHAVLPGAAIGYMFAGLSLPAMSVSGFAAGLLMALLAGLVSRFTSLKEDANFAAFYFEQPCHRRGFGQQKRQQRRFAAFAVWLGVGGGYSGFAADCRFCERHYFADGGHVRRWCWKA